MDFLATAVTGVYAGLFASAIGVMLTAPPRYIVPAFFCGFAGRCARDGLTSLGMSQSWATVAAACIVVLVAVAAIRRHVVSPVVMISGALPIGAAIAMFNLIIGLMRIPSLDGAALTGASVAMSADAGRVLTTSLAIALGLGAGMVIVRLLNRAEVWERV